MSSAQFLHENHYSVCSGYKTSVKKLIMIALMINDYFIVLIIMVIKVDCLMKHGKF